MTMPKILNKLSSFLKGRKPIEVQEGEDNG